MYPRIYVLTYVRAHVRTCVRAYVHTYVRNVRSYVRTYVRTYVTKFLRDVLTLRVTTALFWCSFVGSTFVKDVYTMASHGLIGATKGATKQPSNGTLSKTRRQHNVHPPPRNAPEIRLQRSPRHHSRRLNDGRHIHRLQAGALSDRKHNYWYIM